MSRLARLPGHHCYAGQAGTPVGTQIEGMWMNPLKSRTLRSTWGRGQVPSRAYPEESMAVIMEGIVAHAEADTLQSSCGL